MLKIFVSYRRADSAATTARIYDSLSATFDSENVFMDVDTIPGGQDFRTVITDWMTQSDVLLVVIGDSWLSLTDDTGQRRIDTAGDYVRYEIELGLRLSKVTVIPVIIGDARPPSANDLPESLHDLAYRNAVFVRTDSNFEPDISNLINKLKTGKAKRARIGRVALLVGALLVLVVLVFILLNAGLLNNLSSASTTTAQEVLFTRGEVGSREIYKIDVLTHQETALTNHTADDYSPRWSADGKQIAFISVRTGSANIFVIDADGSNLHQITSGQEQVSDIVWSPIDERIAFIRRSADCSGLYIINADGTDLRELTCDADSYPDWSPDSKQIVFGRGHEIDIRLYVINADGSGLRLLGDEAGIYGTQAQWSPDGNMIAYTFFGASEDYIEAIQVDAKQATLLSPSRNELDRTPIWSPDGKHIAFVSIDKDVWPATNLFIMNPDGSDRQRLTTNDASDYQATWSADSRQLAFTTDRNGNQDIYTVSVDATNLKPLVDTAEDENDPQWRPAGTAS